MLFLFKELENECISEKDANESINSVQDPSEKNTDQTDNKIDELDTSKIEEDDMDVDDTVSISSNSNHAQNDTSINSASDSENIELTKSSSKKLTPSRVLKQQKKLEEKLKLKQVSNIYGISILKVS